MPYTLLLIDLQAHFEEPDPDFLHEVQNLVLDAINDGSDIALVEYIGYGATWREIRQLVKGYENCRTIRKDDQDGGRHVARQLKRLKMRTDEIRVGGLYAEWCVRDTVTTMAQLMPSSHFRIRRRACISNSGRKEDVWKNWINSRNRSKQYRNIKFA